MSRAPVLFSETRLSPIPNSSAQILSIPGTGSSQPSTLAAGRKRGFEEISTLDEEGYARRYLASEGSVFFRRSSRSPRSFLWRIIDDRKVIEVQCVDLVHGTKTPKGESLLTFRLVLPGEIVRDGVVFADPEDTDALEAFVLTTANDLYTFTLKRDLLTRESVPEKFDPTTVVKKYASSSLQFRKPYRMVAVSSLELFISLQDGGLLRLERQPNSSGSIWRETFFSDAGWSGTLRGLIPLRRHQTVTYGQLELEPNAVAAMAKSPDDKYIWTVTLEHELKAWSVKSGKSVAQMDLLNENLAKEGRQPQQKYLMNAEQRDLIQVLELPTSSKDRTVAKLDISERPYCIVVCSPKDHQFKFYVVSVSTSEEGEEGIEVRNMRPSMRLIPPLDELLNTNVWYLENFHVHPSPDWTETQVWIRARSGKVCKTFTVTLALSDPSGGAVELEDQWGSGWSTVDTGLQTVEELRTFNTSPVDGDGAWPDGVSPTEHWLKFLFFPDRFSSTSIEAALHIYRKGRNLPLSSSKGINAPVTPLPERLSQAITSRILLRRTPNDQPDFDSYQAEIHAQWRTFYTLLAHLHSRRQESIGFAFDDEDVLPWTVFADFVSPVRASSSFEKLQINRHYLDDESLQLNEEIANQIFPPHEEDSMLFSLAQLMAAAKDFRAGLSAYFRQKFASATVLEALKHDYGDEEHSKQRVLALYETNRFNSEVMDDDFQTLEKAAQHFGGLGSLTPDEFLAVIERLSADAVVHGTNAGRHLNRYGAKLTIAVARETLERDRGVLLDMLTLLIFMFGDLDQAELHESFVRQVGELFDAYIVRLKQNELLTWLVSHEIEEPIGGLEDSGATARMSLLERIFIGDWSAKSRRHESVPELLTKWSKEWTYGLDLFDSWNGVTGHIMSFLLHRQHYDLATQFTVFLSRDEQSPSWLRYLEGRLFLMTGDHAMASAQFNAAAEELSDRHVKIGSLDTAHLLDSDERNAFGHGQSLYYQHVSSLFERLQIWSYTADFAALAIEHFDVSHLSASLAEVDRRKRDPNTSPMDKVDQTAAEIQLLKKRRAEDELRNRLFNALLQTGRWDDAFQALAQISELPIRKSGLVNLVNSTVQNEEVDVLLGMDFDQAGLADDVDAVLADKAKTPSRDLANVSTVGAVWYQILYAFRTQRANFRGAAEVLYSHLQHLRQSKVHGRKWMEDPEDETLLQAYILLINTLACCGEDDAWLLAERTDAGQAKRKLVTLADVRREYVIELDKRSEVLMGRFALVSGLDDGDGMEVDEL